ncbi:MAG: hypothetical protein ABH871_01445 [Pseudomonadota bacterium]
MEKIRNVLRNIARPFALKVVHRPVGIWLAWAALIYSVWTLAPRLWTYLEHPLAYARTLSDVVVTWPIIIAAVISLAMRKLIARTFGSIVIMYMLIHAIFHVEILGMCLGLLGFAGLLINRRWFDEKLPNVE